MHAKTFKPDNFDRSPFSQEGVTQEVFEMDLYHAKENDDVGWLDRGDD